MGSLEGLRCPIIVSPVCPLTDLLNTFKEGRAHMAFVSGDPEVREFLVYLCNVISHGPVCLIHLLLAFDPISFVKTKHHHHHNPGRPRLPPRRAGAGGGAAGALRHHHPGRHHGGDPAGAFAVFVCFETCVCVRALMIGSLFSN